MRRNGVDMARVKIIVCGNKSDLQGREVNPQAVQSWCQKRGYAHFDTSANTSSNVQEAFEYLFTLCTDQYFEDKKKFGL